MNQCLAVLSALAAAVAVAPVATATTVGGAEPGSGVGGVSCWRHDSPDYTDPSSAWRTGHIMGGPYPINDGADLRSGRLVCSVQHGTRHSDPDLASARSETTTGVVLLPPTPIAYETGPGERYGCTQVEIDGAGTFYYDPGSGWSTDPDALCVRLPDER